MSNESIPLKIYLSMLATGDRPRVYIAAMYQALEVTGTAPDMWIVTGSNLTQRSWCCHANTPLFFSRESCEAYIELIKAADQRIKDKYNGVRS